MAEEDFTKFTAQELIEEIAREEAHLAELRRILAESEAERDKILLSIEEEKLPDKEERYKRRANRIDGLTRAIGEYDLQIRRWQGLLTDTEERIRTIEESVAFQERRARTAIGLVERYTAALTAERLRRTRTGLRGYRTRILSTLTTLRDLRAWTIRIRAGLRGQQRKEEPLIKRLSELRTRLTELETLITATTSQIAAEEVRLEKKKVALPKFEIIHSKIVIYAITESEKVGRPYEKRFQAFFNVDAIRNPSTGEKDYSHELTKKELDACTWEFYMRWNWVKEGEPIIPKGTSMPEWADAGEWEPIQKPEGATIKELSVIEEEEETYYQKIDPPLLIYLPTKEESRAMLKYIGKTDEEIDKILGE